ncbi:MAG: hypothetical protein JWQ96_188 [Segetibacter sp.]|nr:hypothetical protein [Segetibacter sp.]
MKNFDWKKLVPHAIAIAIFLVVALFYCKPALEGKVLQQSDIIQWKGMSKDIYNYKDTHGEAPLWTNGMFSGMPSYMIATKVNNHVPHFFTNALSLFLGKPFQFFFLACVCFYFLSQVLRTNTWVGVIGSLAYAYATYNVVIVSVGHDTKMLSIAMMPGLLASLILIYERKYWWGAALTSFFAGAIIAQNHYQVAYYGMLAALAMTIGYAVNWIRNKQYKEMFVAGAIALAAGLVGVFSNAVVILTNYEYTNESIRGGTALASGEVDGNFGKNGLTKNYAFSYSMNKAEAFVLMVPRIYGGSSNHMEVPETESKAVQALQNMQPEVAQQLQNNLSFYWGEGHTSGPPYAGAIICFLAILGFVILDNKHKWWILATLFLTILMSWGGYFESFNTLLFNVLPLYNKFRAPGMIIVVPTLLVGMMAILSLQKILFGFENKAELFKQFKKGLMITGGVFVLLLLVYFSLDYRGEGDTALLQQLEQIPDAQQKAAYMEGAKSLINGLVEDRKGLFFGDIIRSLLFIAVAAAAIWMNQRKVLKPGIVMMIVGVLSFIDVMAIDSKYLNADNYKEQEESDASFSPTPADLQILKDTSYYRVFNVAGGNVGLAFNHGALTSYFHKSIGGYHPAKLSLYQDLIEKQLYNFPNCQPVINMLNTKYIIYGDPANPQVQQNPDALGAAWFVTAVKFVNSPQEEMAALTNLNVRDTAVANKSFSNTLKSSFPADSAATINLVKNDNDLIIYSAKTATERAAVFSEVYYDKGWKAFIDSKEVPIAKVNYVLRGLMVPAGVHTIEFKFQPASHATGWTITTISSVIMILLFFAAIYFEIRRKNSGSAIDTQKIKKA